MIVWDIETTGESTPVVFCDCCGQEIHTWKDGRYIEGEELDGKWYCEDCLRENINSL